MTDKAKTVGELMDKLFFYDTRSEIYISGDYDGDGHLRVLDGDEWVEIEVSG